jgi:hypothetical protein
VVYFGDDDPTDNLNHWVEFSTSLNPTIRQARPVEIIRSYGQSNGSLAVVEVEVRRVPLNFDTEGVVYARNNVVSNGSVNIDGNDHAGTGGATCGGVTEPPVPPVYTFPTGTVTTLNGASNTLAGDPPNPVSGDKDIPITDYVEAMGLPGGATIVITSDQNGTTYGADGDGKRGCLLFRYVGPLQCGQGLKLQGVTGYGLLAVKGDLTLGGGFTWSGLVIATGTLTFNGGGGPNRINVTGAVLANQTVTMNGSVDLFYDSCYIEECPSGNGRPGDPVAAGLLTPLLEHFLGLAPHLENFNHLIRIGTRKSRLNDLVPQIGQSSCQIE